MAKSKQAIALKKLWADHAFRAKMSASGKKVMTRLWKNRRFRAKMRKRPR